MAKIEHFVKDRDPRHAVTSKGDYEECMAVRVDCLEPGEIYSQLRLAACAPLISGEDLPGSGAADDP